MVAWVVIYRPHPRRSPLSRRSFHLSSHLSLFTVVHPLSLQPDLSRLPRASRGSGREHRERLGPGHPRAAAASISSPTANAAANTPPIPISVFVFTTSR